MTIASRLTSKRASGNGNWALATQSLVHWYCCALESFWQKKSCFLLFLWGQVRLLTLPEANGLPWKLVVGRWISFWDGLFSGSNNVSFRGCTKECFFLKITPAKTATVGRPPPSKTIDSLLFSKFHPSCFGRGPAFGVLFMPSRLSLRCWSFEFCCFCLKCSA